MATGVLVTLVFATLISYPFLRLKGGYFALANFGLIKLFELVSGSLRNFTGGPRASLCRQDTGRIKPITCSSEWPF